MTTKTEYRNYIASEDWQMRRREHLEVLPWCDECRLPRGLSKLLYDEDLHVHHRNYSRVGKEESKDLQTLCKRCHEVKTFGHSALAEGDLSFEENPVGVWLVLLAEYFDCEISRDYCEQIRDVLKGCSHDLIDLLFSEALRCCRTVPSSQFLEMRRNSLSVGLHKPFLG